MKGVVLVVFAVAAGLVVGYAKRGRLRHLLHPPPVRNRLLLTALGLYILAVFASWAWDSALAVLSALSWFVIAFYAWVNRWMPGARLVAMGLAANALVLIFNGAVPVSPEAAARAGVDVSAATSGSVQTVDESTHLEWLSKNIPVAFPPSPEVVSPGDLAFAAGLATILATGMTGRRPMTNELPRTRRYRYDVTPGEGSAPGTEGSGQDEAHATMGQRSDRDTAPIGRQASA